MSADLAEFGTPAKGLVFVSKLAAGLAKRVRDQEDHEAVAEVQSEVASIQEELSRLQKRDSSMQQEIAYLKQTIVDMKNWEEEEQRYRLKSIAESAFVYSLKESHRVSEPPHWLCPQCFGERRKSILHRRRIPNPSRRRDLYLMNWDCNKCNLSLEIPRGEAPKFKTVAIVD